MQKITIGICEYGNSTDYVMRIMDNLTSNIVKYADPSVPVAISAVEEGSMTGFLFLFENKVKKRRRATESGYRA